MSSSRRTIRALQRLRSSAALSALFMFGFAVLAQQASARTVPALIRAQTVASNKSCYTFGDSAPSFWGVSKSSAAECSSSQLVIPLLWDNPSFLGTTREVRVVGRRASSASFLRCRAMNFHASGDLASQSSLVSITSTSYTTVSLFLNWVPAGSYGFVRCEMSSDSSATAVVNLDYTP